MNSPQFIRQIEILRGLSILLVLLYHLKFQSLPSGYLGVDIFFVLSGTLMGLLYPDLSTREAVIDFYGKRANRILPAYFTILVGTVVTAYFLVLPHEFQEVIRSGWYSIFLMPNIESWMRNSYFAKADFTPLLHYWSLGVELQFYLVYPLFALLLRKSRSTFAVVSLLSLLLCFYVTQISPKTSFFLTPLRLWEFGVGLVTAMLFRRFNHQIPHWARWISVVLFTILILLSALDYPESEHPGYGAVAVCLIAASIIVLGFPVVIERSVAGKGCCMLGKYSYSIYLVHFPVIVFGLYRPFSGIDYGLTNVTQVVLLISVILSLSFGLYHMVEKPFRFTRTRAYHSVQYGLILLVCIFSVLMLPSWQAGRFTEEQRKIFGAWNDRAKYRCGKVPRILEPFNKSCTLSVGSTEGKSVLIVGDSHADAIKTTIVNAARDSAATVYLMKQNCWFGIDDCASRQLIFEILDRHVDTVLLHSSPGKMVAAEIAELVELGETHGFDVVMIDPVPVWPVHIPQFLYNESIGLASRGQAVQDVNDYLSKNKMFFSEISGIQSTRFKRYSVSEFFCAPTCQYSDDSGRPYYFDRGHLTLTGAAALRPVFLRIFQSRDAT